VSSQAHNDGLGVLALCAAVWAGARKQDLAAAVLLALAVLAKHAALPLLVLHLWSVTRRSPARGAAMAAVVALLGIALFLPFWDGTASLRAPLLAAGGAPGRTVRSLVDLACIAAGWIGPESSRLTYQGLWALSAAALAALGLRALWFARSFQDVAHEGLVVLIAYNLLTPWFQPWYLLWLLPLALIERDPKWRAVVALYAGLSTLQYAIPIDPITNVAIDAIVAVAAYRAWRQGSIEPVRAAA